ncbi:DUF3560 domain-containing protein [Bacillus sp. BGMRC0062]|nr:DUF3560 domain-containing protein [Bacillus sp. BGMRC0062]
MAALTITHNREAGTLIEGTQRGDGTAEILKAQGWRWGRSIGAWYVPQSRDRNLKTWITGRTQKALEAAGHEVALEADDTARPVAEVEADRAARQEARAEALAQKAQRKAAHAADAQRAADAAAARLPEGGEPIKVGHHSETRHRNAIDRAWNAQGRAIRADEDATEAQRRASAATNTTAHRYSPATVAGRIDRLEAEGRKLARQLDGYTADRGTPYAEAIPAATGRRREAIQADATENADALAYWRGVRAQQLAAGEAADYSAETIHAGDRIKVGGTWWTVARANAKTCTLYFDAERKITSSYRAPYGKITGHQPANK